MATLGLGMTAVGLAAVSAYLHVHDKDGAGWAVLAFFALLGSCSVRYS